MALVMAHLPLRFHAHSRGPTQVWSIDELLVHGLPRQRGPNVGLLGQLKKSKQLEQRMEQGMEQGMEQRLQTELDEHLWQKKRA